MTRLSLIVFLLCSMAWAEPTTMTLPGFTWQSPIVFGEVQELGPDAYDATYPADVDYEEAKLELVVAYTPRESVVTIQEGGADPKTLALVTFMGLSGRPDQVNKALFMGGTEARTVYDSDVPRRHTAHVFQKYLEDGALVTVGLRDYGGNGPLVGDVLRGISETFAPTFSSGD